MINSERFSWIAKLKLIAKLITRRGQLILYIWEIGAKPSMHSTRTTCFVM
jgi:hypothetical protein